MQATPVTVGCATVAIALGVVGLYLGSLAVIAGAMGLSGLLCGQGVLFLYRSARFAENLHVERVVRGRPVYQGASTEIEVRATTPAVHGLQVRITDLPPQSAVYNPGEAILDNGETHYQVRFMTPGEASFGGLLLETVDRFFTTTIHHATPRNGGNKVVVYPVGGGTLITAFGNSAGARERDRAGVPHADGVSGYRPFHQGDDLAWMDWKLTAKHGRPFVREPTSEVGNAPLVVVDLPMAEDPGTMAVLSAAGKEIRRDLRAYGHCSLLMISGGEVISYRKQERDLEVILRLLSVQPPESIRPLFRIEDPIIRMERLRSTEQELLIPSQRLATVLRTVLDMGMRSAFEREIDRILAAPEHRAVIVYTASTTDVSHLNLLAAAARRRRRRLMIRSPRTKRGMIPWLSPYPHVEAI